MLTMYIASTSASIKYSRSGSAFELSALIGLYIYTEMVTSQAAAPFLDFLNLTLPLWLPLAS